MFFSWKHLIFKKYPEYKNRVFQVVVAERNCGKTYDTFKYVFDSGGFTPKQKVVYLRNTKTELTKPIADLNNTYKGLLRFKGGLIYNLTPFKKDGEEYYKQNEVVGYYASLNDYQNSKGLDAKNVAYFIYDEFNEDTIIGRNLYFKFCNVIKTFERFNKIKYFFVLGNKDGFNNDFFINWDVTPNIDVVNDYVTPIKTFGVFYDIGNQHFKDLANTQTLSTQLMLLDNRTKAYALGGYQHAITNNVIKYNEILQTFKPQFKLAIDEYAYWVGTFNKGYAILSPWNYENDSINCKNYAFNLYSGLNKDSLILDKDSQNDLLEFIYKNEKQKNLFYDSYDTRHKIRDLVYFYTKILQN